MRNPGSVASTTNALMPCAPVLPSARSLPGRGARKHAVEIRDPAVRDPGLGAVEHVVIAGALGAAAHGGDIGAGLGLGQRESGNRLAAGDARQIARLECTVAPASEIAPLPRPCMAKAKSASPS